MSCTNKTDDSPYIIEEQRKLADNILFFRIRISQTDLSNTLYQVFNCLNDLSWISQFDQEYLKQSFQKRAQDTIDYIAKNIIKGDDTKVTTDSGEYVISVLSKKIIVDKLEYLDVPLAELIKEKVVGNPGFDFYCENKDQIILFGEAKYQANENAYGRALKQIVDFINKGKDVKDFASIEHFCSTIALNNASNGEKGFVAAFSCTNIKTETLIQNIQSKEDYQRLSSYNELICIAVTI